MAKKKKHNNGEHIEKAIARRKEKERLTNWYMINLCWGIVGIVILSIFYYMYKSPNTLQYMDNVVIYSAIAIMIAGIAGLLLAKKGVIKNFDRARNYAKLAAAVGGVGVWIALYNKIRPFFEKFLQFVTQNDTLRVSSYWNVWVPMIAIGVYLVVAFIWYVRKESKI